MCFKIETQTDNLVGVIVVVIMNYPTIQFACVVEE